MRIVYDRRYNLGFPGAQRLHPFDLRKFARAWKVLAAALGGRLNDLHVAVPAPATDEHLLLVHTAEYLQSLRQSAVIAQAVEVPALRRAPWWLLDRFVLQPMRWATAGTIIAGREALQHGLAFNLGGGFHHAKPDGGEGFSIYNDIAVLIRVLRAEGRIPPDGRIVYVDLDAHLGNGVAWCFRDDPTVFLLDMHNASIYPWWDLAARERIDCLVPLKPGCKGSEYLERLRAELPPFLASISRTALPALAIYNAGTDVLAGDALGGLSLSLDDVLARDRYVIQKLREKQLPTVVLTSGGYSDSSYQAIARTILGTAEEPEY
jgi:histone deacetylase 11